MNDAPLNIKPPKSPRTRQLHGFSQLLKSRYRADTSQLDGRSAAGQALSAYRADLLSSLGGRDTLSAQEITLVEISCRDWLILQTIDNHLLQAGLFNRRKRTAYPLTLQRQTIADGLTRRLLALGLNRRSKPVRSLSELLAGTPQTEPG
ncbi:MAG: hypothetical protein L0H94_06205 [Nitrospira sp.]|nr:hypothetical protein [Nitrospira sp.]